MKNGDLPPGSVLDLKKISLDLGISSTPLRDSLLTLEAEGYLTIYPRSMVVINKLELDDFPFLYEIMGALEYTVISVALQDYTPEKLSKMRQLNMEMKNAVLAGDMTEYDRSHYEFHEIFFHVRPNVFAYRIVRPIKNRLWDFPRKNFVREWYLAAIDEHALIIDAIEKRDLERLSHAVRELHWGYAYNEASIKKSYGF